MRGAAGMMLASAALLTLPHPFVASAVALAPTIRPAETDAYWAVVTGNAVNLRSGPSAQSAYAFGRLTQGNLVRVAKEEFGWARVTAEGSAFADVVVFVPADRRVTASADGTSITVNARTELRAPNVDAGSSPDKSWKQVGTVEPGTTFASLGLANGQKEDVYRVKAPASTEAWVNLQFLRRATDAEIAATSAVAPATAAATTTAAAPAAVTEAAPASTETPANAPEAGAPAATAAAPATAADLGGGIEPLSSPAIPPLLGEQPKNTSAMAAAEPAPAPKPRRVTARATLDDLEHQFKAVRNQPQADAEFETLRVRYEDLAASTEAGGGIKGLADARARQLALMQQIQQQVQEVQRAKVSADERRKGIAELVLNIERRAEYTAVGILNASAVYDGQRLPELYRVCDALTGATIAYVEPNADVPLATMVGTLVGIKGGKTVDPALRLTVISPMSVELLTQRDTPQVTRTEATRPIEAAGTFEPAPTATDAPHPDAVPCPDNPAPDTFVPAPNAAP
jgi:SH3-like domain-containing protein